MAFSAFLSSLISETHLFLPVANDRIAAMQRACDQGTQIDASRRFVASRETATCHVAGLRPVHRRSKRIGQRLI